MMEEVDITSRINEGIEEGLAFKQIGDIKSISKDENGLTVEYTLNEEGRKLYGDRTL